MFMIGVVIGIFYILIRIMLGLESKEREEKNPMVGMSIFAIILGILYAFGDKK